MLYSLRGRFTVTFIVLLIVPFISMVIVLTQMSNSVIGTSIEESTTQTMDQYASFVYTLTNQVEDVANQVLSNDVTQSWIAAQMDPGLSENKKVLQDIELRKYLSSIALNHSYISTITLFDDKGKAVGIGDQTIRDSAHLTLPWYKEFRAEERRWTLAHKDRYQPSYLQKESVNSLLFDLVHLSTFQSIGVLKVNVLTEAIQEPLEKIKIGETGRVYLLDSASRPVLQQELPEHITEFQSFWKQIQSVKESGGKLTVSTDGEQHVVLYRKLKGTDWVVIGEVPKAELFEKMTQIRKTMLGVAGLLLVLTIGAAYALSGSITRPLSKLVQSMKLAERGEFAGAERQIANHMRHNRTEIGYASKVFQTLVGKVRFLIETEFQTNMRRRDAEYKALLMQINPHFLYNTLEAIGSLAVQERTDDVIDVTESLGQMLRYSLRTDTDMVLLKEEMNYIQHYIAILRIRFGNRLDIAVTAEPELAKMSIVKFIFQPLVENAVKFSQENKAVAVVRVNVRKRGSMMEIEVSDNGTGMPQDVIEELYRQVPKGELTDVLGASGRRIGLRNVLARCYLTYGDRFKVSIEAAPGQGTTIQLLIPGSED